LGLNSNRTLVVALILPLAMIWALPARATPAQSVEKTREICARETQATEQAMAIPAHLLGAISLAESGRWDADAQASFAWPWTVTAEGRGRYFPTKAAALAEVRRLMKRGLTNIDVGCMQINLYYHGGAFADIAEAMDPAANTAYAGQYLKNLFASTGSWTRAAGYYHSMTPERSDAYKDKVVGLWTQTRRLARAEPADSQPATRGSDTSTATARAASAGQLVRPVSIDMARTAALNARLRMARAEERKIDFDTRRRQDLASWRQARAEGRPTGHAALMRRVHAEAERQRELDALADRPTRFAERRRAQLRKWRQAHGGTDEAS
jgi:hypothetical protein